MIAVNHVANRQVSFNQNVSLVDSWHLWEREASGVQAFYRYAAVQRLRLYLDDISSETLDLSNLNLTSLPALLPNSVARLQLHNNRLEYLPASLPTSLKVLNVCHNQLNALPDRLPAGLTELYATDNPLERLPHPLPASLNVIVLDNTSVLDGRHNQFYQPSIQFNLLSAVAPDSANEVRQVDTTDDGRSLYESVLCSELSRRRLRGSDFIRRIALWTQNTDGWRAMEGEENAHSFGLFLSKLHSGGKNRNSTLKKHVSQWLDYLCDDRNRSVRQKTFLLAHEASASCVDRASFYFNKMYACMVEDKLTNSNGSIKKLFKINRGLFRMQVLEKVAARKVAQKRLATPGFKEDIEVYLVYQYKLRKTLSLPVHARLHHSPIAELTDEDLDQAIAVVHAEEQRDFLRYLVTESSSWQARLIEWNSEKAAQVDDDYLQQLNSDDFGQSVDQKLLNMKLAADDDGRDSVIKQQADELLYQTRYQLTKQFLTENNALDLITQLRAVPPRKMGWLASLCGHQASSDNDYYAYTSFANDGR